MSRNGIVPPTPRHRRAYAQDAQKRPMGAGLSLYGVRRDGTEFPIDIALNTVDVEGGPLVLAAVRDVSDRNILVSQLQAAKESAAGASRVPRVSSCPG